ncbi:MAG: triose-phosphate isomerase [Bdellovibrionales bacterium]|nr:triose-phosphate isomerase [Bdellovibrionales bacterium]
MNKSVADAIRLVTELKNYLTGKVEAEIVVAPSFVSLHPVEIAIQGTSIKLAAQNMYHEDSGAFTGEISPLMLVDVGVKYVVLGHSERRQIFSENNHLINKKVLAAQEYDLHPILCLGETKEQRASKATFDVIETQLKECLRGVHDSYAANVVIAYEPVWAIGSGEPATPDQAQEVHHFIREQLSAMFRKDIANQIRILYGGSVNPSNVRDFMNQDDVDGVLAGGASLETSSFVSLIHSVDGE